VADFGQARVWFNLNFSPPRSYSIPLRPDIALSVNAAGLHLFDAKLKRENLVDASASEAEIEEQEQRATYRRGDLYKMHTYRDALGAQSVWILFPGRSVDRVHFEPRPASQSEAPSGVGALPLLPGREEDEARLRDLVATMIFPAA
jgi:predicted component of viral defense system (DUF524 family)